MNTDSIQPRENTKSARIFSLSALGSNGVKKTRESYADWGAGFFRGCSLIRVHHGCGNFPARILLLDQNQIGARQRASATIDAGHKTHSDHAGLPLHSLRAMIGSELPLSEVFDALVAELCQTGFVQVGVALKRAAHQPALPPQLQAAGAKLRAALTHKPFDPPSRKDLTPDTTAQQALRFALQTGEAVEISAEVMMAAGAFDRATEVIRKHLQEHSTATVSELRQALGTSRRVVVPLLERLDRIRVTIRQGDQRVLRSGADTK